jgi:hypothetical protein
VQGNHNAAEQSSGVSSVRGEIELVKQHLMTGLDQVIHLLDQIDTVQNRAHLRLQEAERFHQAVRHSRQIGRQLADAHAAAAEARTAYDIAQTRVAEATRAWDLAEEAAEQAAVHARRLEAATSAL